MSFFKTVLALLLLMVAGAKLSAQCGTIRFTPPVVVGNTATFEVWYDTPPSTINSLDLYVSLGAATYASAVGNLGFSASYSTGFGAVRIQRSSSYTPTGNFKLCDITFSLPLNQSTNICLSAGVVVHPGGNCFPSNLMTNTCISYTMPSVTINGSAIKIPLGSSMNNVQVVIVPISGFPQTVQTYSQGTYTAIMAPSASFTATASRDDASSQCGITEYDVTLAQRVIVNYSTFSQPYEPIAADVNRSGSVTTLDLIKMQQVILGQSSFTQDWEFVPFGNYNGLSMPSTPTQVPTYSTIMQIGSNSSNTFYGIKYGDVDGSGSSCAQSSFAEPVASKMIRIGKALVQADKTILIPVYGKQFQSEMLFSLGLQFNPALVQIIGLKAGALPEFNENCYAIDANQSGLVNILWINTKSKTGISIKSNEPLFYVQGKLSSTDTKISERVVSLSYDRLQNISINSSENFRKGEALGLEFEEAEGGANILSLPIDNSSKMKTGLHPNPFKNQLNLNLNTPIGGEAELRLMNQNGQLLLRTKMDVISGTNNISLGQLDAIPSGVVLYQLVLPGKVLSGKLIKE